MNIQHSIPARRLRESWRERVRAPRTYPTKVLRRTIRHLSTQAHPVVATRDQKHLILTGVVLGCVGILTFFFPVCALLAAGTGLTLGLYGRYNTPLQRMAIWAIALSAVGLLLAGIDFVLLVNNYISMYALR